ncbi:MAG TPA: ABC transporter ATP-binding protein [Thermoanaerobaculaceae bacterium]|nr:ABC transporter ATP-binding protein [Thermoanaerobaculaceae bacterium]
MSADPLLAVEELSKTFGGLRAVIGVSFAVAEGEILGLIGPNGSGKTTVLDMISGALRPDGGRVRLAGRDLTALPASTHTHLGIARTFQLVRPLPNLSTLDNVLVARLYGRDRPGHAAAREESLRLLELIGLRPKAHVPATGLTLTERKRLEIARALATHPKVLLLDEPLGGLNQTELRSALGLFGRLREDGVTLVIVEHNVPAVRALCTRVIVLNTGRLIAEGDPEDVLTRREVVEVYLGAASRGPSLARFAPAGT